MQEIIEMFTDKKTGYEEFLILLKEKDDIHGLNVSGLEFDGLDFSKKKFTGCNFSNTKFIRCRCRNV